MEGGGKSVSKMLAKSLAGGGWIGRRLGSLLLLSRVGGGYNLAVDSIHKETASLIRGDCRARAAHPSVVGYIVVEPLGFVKWNWRSLIWNV
jgi:hypothetical protein